MALLAKWRWSLFHQNDSLWARVLYSRYGGGTNLCAQSSSRRDSIWWRDLLMVCGGLEQDNWFERKIKWRIGSGARARFWLDNWTGPICLASVFPRLFTISEQQNHFIQDMGSWTDSSWVWQLQWRRERFEWEIQLEQQLMQQLLECSPRAEQVDSWWWLGEPSGTYTVRSAYSAITSEVVVGSNNGAPNIIWSIPAPPKVKIFAWRMMSRGLPTVDNLASRSITISDNDALCVFCKQDIETDYHLFCTCSVVDKVWKSGERDSGSQLEVVVILHKDFPMRYILTLYFCVVVLFGLIAIPRVELVYEDEFDGKEA
ncbi:uncharacterized protein LOC109795944 [Cajanus cajan]|uniref:uncharacterized protein LOC109795944 n=1 Tax=Cajanus cajan TaxID=3821 RepID=UPI00098D8335|nr:uncharacterized protein LOC109795944 [Cajanus cajan]